jgi:ribosome biogenesis GTPase A
VKKEFKLFKKALENSKFAVQLLDSRYILDSINEKAEKIIKEKNIPLIYVVNKWDLIDNEDKELIKNKIKEKLGKVFFVSARERRGIKKLREELGKFKKELLPKKEECDDLINMIKGKNKLEVEKIVEKLSEEEKEKLKLCKEGVRGVIFGYPNVGKSSLINILKGKHSAPTSPIPGFTKAIQLVKISNKLYLIDIPGLFDEEDKKKCVLGLINTNKVSDPWELVDFLWCLLKEIRNFKNIERELKKYKINKEFLENLDDWEYFEEKLEEIAKRNNYIMSGGKPDIFRLSKKIIEDWQKGNIKAYRIDY